MTDYYVDGATGSDTNLGTSEGAGNAWLTITRALDGADASPIIAGDTIYIKSSVTYSEDVPLDVVGTSTAPIRVVGYDTVITDEGKVTISGTTNCILIGTAAAPLHYKFENLIFTGASGTAVNIGATLDNAIFQNCEFNNSGNGLLGDNSYDFYNCIFSGNTGYAALLDGWATFIKCRFTGNGGTVLTLNHGVIAFCEFYNNAGQVQINWDFTTGPNVVLNCTFDGENNASSEAIVQDHLSANAPLIALNNIIYDFGTGIRVDATGRTKINIIGHNLINSNTADYNANCENTVGGDVTTAPQFTAEGSDYSLATGSPAIDAGTDAADIT